MPRLVFLLGLMVFLTFGLDSFCSPQPKEPSYRLVFFRRAVGEGIRGVFTIKPDGSEERLLLSQERVRAEMINVQSVAFSPDGRWFIYLTADGIGPGWEAANNTLRLSKVGDSQSKVIARADDLSFLPPYAVWSPDSQHVAFVRAGYFPHWEEFGAQELWVTNLLNGQSRRVAKDTRINPEPYVIRWFGEKLFWIFRDALHSFDLGTGQISTIAEGLPYGAVSVCCGGRKLIVGTQYVPQHATEAMAQLASRLRESGWELIEKPYGADADAEGRIIVYRVGSQIWMTYLGSGESQMLMERPRGSEAASIVGISPDSRWVAFWTYDGLETVEIPTGQHYLTVPGDHRPNVGPERGPEAVFIGWAREP